jgi:hypothetical protein
VSRTTFFERTAASPAALDADCRSKPQLNQAVALFSSDKSPALKFRVAA